MKVHLMTVHILSLSLFHNYSVLKHAIISHTAYAVS